jgi:hypothetical protein
MRGGPCGVLAVGRCASCEDALCRTHYLLGVCVICVERATAHRERRYPQLVDEALREFWKSYPANLERIEVTIDGMAVEAGVLEPYIPSPPGAWVTSDTPEPRGLAAHASHRFLRFVGFPRATGTWLESAPLPIDYCPDVRRPDGNRQFWASWEGRALSNLRRFLRLD